MGRMPIVPPPEAVTTDKVNHDLSAVHDAFPTNRLVLGIGVNL